MEQGPWADSETLADQKEKKLKSKRQRRYYGKRKLKNLCTVNGCKRMAEPGLTRCVDHTFRPDFVESYYGGGPGRPKTRAINKRKKAKE
jgi:hypothetical protein